MKNAGMQDLTPHLYWWEYVGASRQEDDMPAVQPEMRKMVEQMVQTQTRQYAKMKANTKMKDLRRRWTPRGRSSRSGWASCPGSGAQSS